MFSSLGCEERNKFISLSLLSYPNPLHHGNYPARHGERVKGKGMYPPLKDKYLSGITEDLLHSLADLAYQS
jgi:hypothetical protein